MANRDTDLQNCFATASRRMRVQRLVTIFGGVLKAASVILLLYLALVLVLPRAGAWGLMVLVLTLACCGIALLVSYLWPWPDDAVAREIDRRFDLPDHVITSKELGASLEQPWIALQREDTRQRLRKLDWQAAWPIRWPRLTGFFATVAAVLALLVAARFVSYAPPSLVAQQTKTVPAAKTLEEIFKDWDKAAEKTDDPELKKLLAEIQPMREQMPKMNERDLMLAINKLENKLQALRDAATKDSMEAASGEMASAFENMEDMGALAAALRRNDFEAAEKQAGKNADKLAQKDAAAPKGAESAATQQQMEQAANKLEKSGQSSAASAMQQMKQGGQKQDAQQMSKGMSQLSKNFGNEAKRQGACSSLGLQLSQLGQCKGQFGQKPGQGQGEGEGSGMSMIPKLADKVGGKGAGSESDPNRVKEATNLDGSRTAQNLTGTVGEGESQTENLKSETPSGEAPRGERTAQFSQYEKLSQQAIADESLPLAYREAIRKYFETIRPSNEK